MEPNTRTHYRITPPSLDYPHKEQDLTPGDLQRRPASLVHMHQGQLLLRGILDKDSLTQDASLIIFSEMGVEIIITKR